MTKMHQAAYYLDNFSKNNLVSSSVSGLILQKSHMMMMMMLT